MKGLVHINILEDFITKQKYSHIGNRMLIGSSMLLPSSAQALFVGNHTADACPGEGGGPGAHPEESLKAIVQEGGRGFILCV